MKSEDLTNAIAERFLVDGGAVSPMVEDYLFNKISHDQFKDRLRNVILQRSQVRAGSSLESL